MKYRKFGETGVDISVLGFGAMRLPMISINDKRVIDEDKAIPMLRKAYDSGVNYFDTAYMYCDGLSEAMVGKALKDVRENLYISTKYPNWGKGDKDDYRKTLEVQMKRLDVSYVDFYHFHGLNAQGYEESLIGKGLLKEALRAKEEGLIRHISFSFHDKPEALKMLADTGDFETVLCQYNFLDRSNEEAIAHAKSKGMGVVVMGPVAGGRIAGMTPDFAQKAGIKVSSNAELAMRFVFANRNVDCALSGMSSMEMVEENVVTASHADNPLTESELHTLDKLMNEYRRLSELYCTGCNYCMPCPQGVNIPFIFSQMNNYRIYGLKDLAKSEYAQIGKREWTPGEKADKCVECGICETKCPQKIEIIRQLKECAAALGE
ncbi:MAG: aldo/keto reductase [Saccharofermentanales bacterium]